jgi:hypothetical protein
MSESPSSRLRTDINGLLRWAHMAPPYADECDWGPEHYADNIYSTLRELDQEFDSLSAEAKK